MASDDTVRRRVSWVFACAAIAVLGCGSEVEGTGSTTTGSATGSGSGGSGSTSTGTGGGADCDAGFADCDGDPGNGCEVDTASTASDCGRCGRDCQGQLCSNGLCEPETLSADDQGLYVYQLALDDTHVYWAANLEIRAVNKGGGLVQAVCMLDDEAGGVAVHNGLAYWTGLFTGLVQSAPIGGGVPTTLGTSVEFLNNLVVDDDSIYFTNHDNSAGFAAKIPIGGGNPFTFGTGPAHSPAIDDAYVYWTAPTAIRRAHKADGTGLETVVDDVDVPSGIAVDDTSVFYTTASGAVRVVPKVGGDPTTLAFNQGTLNDIAVDGARVYWHDHIGGDLLSSNKDGSGLQTMATAQAYTEGAGLALDDTYVYWVGALNRIYRTPK